MEQKNINVEPTSKLALLQREYILKTVAGLEEMIFLADALSNLEDPSLIEAYSKKINEVDSEVQNNYKIASKILPMKVSITSHLEKY